MTDIAGTAIVAEFEVTGWDQTPYDEDSGGASLARATVRKTFHGALEGTSVAELLMAGGEGGRGYVASERFIGTIDGRRGSVVFQHGGIDDGASPFTFGRIVPGTGTEGLAGLIGEITYRHDEAGATVSLLLG